MAAGDAPTANAVRLQLELADGRRFPSGLPVLAGEEVERLFAPAESLPDAGCFSLARAGDWLVGAAALAPGAALAETTRATYTALFAATTGWRLARVWNYLPAINAAGPDGLENYRAFNEGRSRAFEAAFGPGFRKHVPAASAVGSDAGRLVVFFAAVRGEVRHVENPRQLPAYEYPPEHGPRPPSFARATIVGAAAGRADVLISGTSSIIGHATVAPAATLQQLACTLDNLGQISHACGLGPGLARGRTRSRHFKVYLRDAADLPAVQAVCARELLAPADQVSYLRSDICRRELNIEIEATLRGAQVDC